MSTPSRVWPVSCPCCRHYVYKPAGWIELLEILSVGKGNKALALTNTQISQRLRLNRSRTTGIIHAAKKHGLVKSAGWGAWTKTPGGHHCLSRWKAAGWRADRLKPFVSHDKEQRREFRERPAAAKAYKKEAARLKRMEG